MASVNKVILVGNLGGDPEIRYTPGGQPVANFNIATNERWNNKQTGQPEERTEWHKIVVWGKLAELCRDYLSKGRTAYVEGRLQTRKWEDKQGQPRWTTEVIANTIQFLGARGDRPAETQGDEISPSIANPIATSASTNSPPAFDSDEEIPF